jgi:hypothetical protein
MQLMVFFLFGSAVLAGLWWWLVVTPSANTPAQSAKIGGSAVVLSVISLLWVCNFLRLLFHL